MLNQETEAKHSKTPRRNPTFKPGKSILILLLLLTVACSLYQIKQVKSATIRVPIDYPEIQSAVIAAVAGDTIQVSEGIYYEHIYVNKSLTIEGANPQTTIVDGTANGTIFDLDAKNIRIRGFTIRNAGDRYNAINIDRDLVTTDSDVISNNMITTSGYGIYLSASDQNTITNNTFINNPFGGIYANAADSMNVTENTIEESAYGIRGVSSLNNIIIGNTISKTSYTIHLTSASTGNIIRRNTLSGKTSCIYTSSDSTTVDHNTIIDGSSSIYFANNRFGSIYYNTIINSSYGIRLYASPAITSNHNVNNNKIVDSDWAIELQNSNGNTLTGNWLQDNTYGIYMTASSTTIYHNNFVNNAMGAYAGGGAGNVWDDGSQGNYWSDYPAEYDTNGDGIGEKAYNITIIGKDYHPLINTWSEHDVATVSVSTSANQGNPDTVVDVTVKVRNNANISVSETFTVTAKYNSTNIETKTVTNLAQGATQILVFNWNTTGVTPGNYTISAEASTVPDELNTDNNNKIDGTVLLTIGDLDHDGDVDGADFGIFAPCYGSSTGQPAYNPEADFDHDGDVDGADFGIFAPFYGVSW
jgi:parallel beta-helix repeat protein